MVKAFLRLMEWTLVVCAIYLLLRGDWVKANYLLTMAIYICIAQNQHLDK